MSDEAAFVFQFTHTRKSDGAQVGLLPDASGPERICFAYRSPQMGGQTYERYSAEFHHLFKEIE